MPHINVGRTARYELLGATNDAPREIWYVLHGYGQLAESFIRVFECLDDGTRLIVAPEALNRFYLVSPGSAPAVERPVGATWMTREDRDHDIADYVAYLDALAARIASSVRHSESRIVVLGFSQGTATAGRWVTGGAIRPRHLVLWGGFLPPEIALDSPALRRVSLHLLVGTRDQYASIDRVAAEEQRLAASGLRSGIARYDGGHHIRRERLLELAREIGAPNE